MTIVVGYVPTEEGSAAMIAAEEEARLRGGELYVVNAATHHNFAAATYADERQLDAVRAAVEQSGVTASFHQPPDVDPAEAIIDAVREVGAELLVIGIRWRTPIGKLILGSTAQRLLLEAPCPVLAVKSPARLLRT